MLETIDITARKMAETDLAVLVKTGKSGDAVWLPKSQIEVKKVKIGGRLSLSIPKWLAMDRGLI